MSEVKIFCVNGDSITSDSWRSLLKNYDYHCYIFPDAESALQAIPVFKPRVILYKLERGDDSYFDFLDQLQEINKRIKSIVITEHQSVELAVRSLKKGAFDFITYPFSSERLIESIGSALKSWKRTNNVRNIASFNGEIGFCGMIGCSSEIQNIFVKVCKIARTNANVLILGESGTGKELLARAIHLNSQRKERQFIPVACTALPTTLLESELFGYEKGSFTGANATKIGLIELANKGTLFLDEITEIPLEMQPKLLRFLQDRKIRRVGGLNEIEVDIRIITASNSDPLELIKEDKFREDLYYRLNVIRFELPPLRKRKKDIPLLANYFIDKFNKQIENGIRGIDETALRALKSYHWPGNIRQLENVIEHAVIVAEKDVIEVKNLPEEIREKAPYSEEAGTYPVGKFKEAKKQYLEHFEKKYITDLLKKHKGNISQAAKDAGINRRTIYRMIELYKITF